MLCGVGSNEISQKYMNDNLPGFAASIIVEVMYIPVHVQIIPFLCYIYD